MDGRQTRRVGFGIWCLVLLGGWAPSRAALTGVTLDTRPELTEPDVNDVFYILHDPAGAKLHRKIKLGTLREEFNVRHYGATGDGVTDDAAALQAAIGAAGVAGGVVYLPKGTYRCNSALTYAGTVRITLRGEHQTLPVITAGAAMEALIHFNHTTTQQNMVIENFLINANELADYGIRGVHLRHSYISRCYIQKAVKAGVWLADAVGTAIQDTIIYDCADGVHIGGASNNLTMRGCLVWNSAGIGVRIGQIGEAVPGSSFGIAIQDCIIEGNPVTGVFANLATNLVIADCYWELNGSTGWTSARPAVTIKADIILNGEPPVLISGDGGEISSTSPVYNAVIERNMFQSAADANCAVWVSCGRSPVVRDNYQHTRGVPLVTTYGVRTTSYVYDLRVENNYTDSNQVEIQGGLGTMASNTDQAHSWRVSPILSGGYEAQPGTNYLGQNFLNWAVISADGGTITRAAGQYLGSPIADLYDTTTATSYWGWTLDLDNDYPELQGKQVVYGVWGKWTGTNMNMVLYSSTDGANTASYSANTGDWRYISRVVEMPASGSVSFAVRKLGTEDAHLYVARPSLTVLGVHRDDIEFPPVTWAASAVPAAGTWAVGDIVRSSDPDPGEPLGWVCTTAGTPGTWSKFGGLESANAYATSSVTTTRTLNADGGDIAVVSDVLATLIEDLKAAGVLKTP